MNAEEYQLRTENYLETLVQRLRLPFIDVIAYQNHRPIFRWYGGDGREHVDGHEKLFNILRQNR